MEPRKARPHWQESVMTRIQKRIMNLAAFLSENMTVIPV
jgi:hypothetical protein